MKPKCSYLIVLNGCDKLNMIIPSISCLVEKNNLQILRINIVQNVLYFSPNL